MSLPDQKPGPGHSVFEMQPLLKFWEVSKTKRFHPLPQLGSINSLIPSGMGEYLSHSGRTEAMCRARVHRVDHI